jgi:predicted PurR-regulated permease PerM
VVTFVLVILLLLERERIRWVVTHAAAPDRRRPVARALDEMVTVSNQYLIGKLKVMGIMAVVYVTAFSLAGVPYAPFLALLIAMSSIVPYVGNFVGGVLAIVLALAASGTTAAIVVVAVVLLAQPLENYVLEPLVVGKQLSLNPLTTVVAVVAFGAVWGVVGAVIALPLAGMIRVALEHTPSAEPAAVLMSDEAPGKTER